MSYLQAENAYRFSSDALLLAEFALQRSTVHLFEKKRRVKPPFLFLDLGCGCGVVGLEFLRGVQKEYPSHFEHCYVLGLDKNAMQVECAKENAKRFSLERQIDFICSDISERSPQVIEEVNPNATDVCNQQASRNLRDFLSSWAQDKKSLYLSKDTDSTTDTQQHINPRVFDMIMTNPPWYEKNKGHISPNSQRQEALFREKNTIDDFINIGRICLKERGALLAIAKTGLYLDFLSLLGTSLNCTFLQNIYTKEQTGATFFLAEAIYKSRASVVLAPPLFHHCKF